MDVDGLVDEYLMEQRAKKIKETVWILIIDAPKYKRYRAEDDKYFFRDEQFDDEGHVKCSSSWRTNDDELGGLILDEYRKYII